MKTFSKILRGALVTLALGLAGLVHADTFEDKIIGSWVGTDTKGVTAEITLAADHQIEMRMQGDVMNSATLGGQFTWQIDASQNPMHIDFVMEQDGFKDTMKMIFKFKENGDLVLQQSDMPNKRPTEFSAVADDKMIELQRL